MSKLYYKSLIPLFLLLTAAIYSHRNNIFYLGGIQIEENNQDKWAKTVKAAQMNTIEVTIYALQGEWNSDSLKVPTIDAGALAEIRAAKKAGLHVALILRVALDHAFEKNRFLWHGMILPDNEHKLNNWFKRYAFFVETWSKIAQKEQVDILAIGSEMNALSSTIPIVAMPQMYAHFNNIASQKLWESRNYKFEKELKAEDLWVRGFDNYPDLKSYIEARIKAHYEWGQKITFADQANRIELMNQRRVLIQNHWQNIIKNTRQIFDGKLTYAANFDNYMFVNFWQDLDFIGINAYFPLRNPNKDYKNDKKLLKGLVKGWQKVFKDINGFRQKYKLLKKPLLFTELGYIFRENSTITPWEGFGFTVVGTGDKQRLIVWGKEAINYNERKMALDALYKVVKNQGINLQGILYWKLTSQEKQLLFEPFGLALSPNAKDPLQTSLAQFRKLEHH